MKIRRTVAYPLILLVVVGGILIYADVTSCGCAPVSPLFASELRVREIQQCEASWAQEHHGHYLPTLAAMFHEQMFKPDYILPLAANDRAMYPVPQDFMKWKSNQQDAWIIKHAA